MRLKHRCGQKRDGVQAKIGTEKYPIRNLGDAVGAGHSPISSLGGHSSPAHIFAPVRSKGAESSSASNVNGGHTGSRSRMPSDSSATSLA